MGLTIIIGADIAGMNYKETLKVDLGASARVAEAIDVDVHPNENVDYPHIAVEAVRKVAAGETSRTLLMYGTGMGVAIAANKAPGIRTLVTHDSFSVERLMLSDDAQILTLGEHVIGLQLAHRLVREWLRYTFDPESSSGPEVAAIHSYEFDPH